MTLLHSELLSLKRSDLWTNKQVKHLINDINHPSPEFTVYKRIRKTFLRTFLRAELSKECEAQRDGMESVKLNNCDPHTRASSQWDWSSAWSTPWSPPPPSVSCPGRSSSSPGTSTSPGWGRPGEGSEFLNTSRRCSERLELHPPLHLNM